MLHKLLTKTHLFDSMLQRLLLSNDIFFIAEVGEIFCNFEESCAFEDELASTVTERWTRSVQRKTKWDNTLDIRKFNQVSIAYLCEYRLMHIPAPDCSFLIVRNILSS